MSDGEWLHGPALVEWLEEHGLESPHTQLAATLARRVHAWRNGSMANVYTVDECLVMLGLHLIELPDDLWDLERSGLRLGGRGGSRFTEDQREDAARRYLRGESSRAIARELGTGRRNVRAWAERVRRELLAENHGALA